MVEEARIDREMARISEKVLAMGRECVEAVRKTSAAFSSLNREEAHAIVERDHSIDENYKDIEHDTFRVLLLDHPVARDFREIGSALKVITDLERIGDYCVDIATEVEEFPNEPLNAAAEILTRMGECVATMVEKAIWAWEKKDVSAARSLVEDDDRVDGYFAKAKQTFIDILRIRDNIYADQMIVFMMVAKYWERIGDHAVNIGEWVDYSLTGSHKMS